MATRGFHLDYQEKQLAADVISFFEFAAAKGSRQMTSSAASHARPRKLATTRWSLVQQATQGNEAPSNAAGGTFSSLPAAGVCLYAAAAESLFERQWARAVLDRVLQQPREEHYTTERHALFDALVGHLGGVANEGSLTLSAERLQMSAEAIQVSLHRLRKRYRSLLRNEIAQTTNSPAEVDDEIRHLFLALSRT
jgi:hypothetical protein